MTDYQYKCMLMLLKRLAEDKSKEEFIQYLDTMIEEIDLSDTEDGEVEE